MHHCEFLEYSLGPRHEHKPKLLRLPSERFLCTIVLARYKRGKLQLIRHYSFNKLIINAKAWSEPLLQSPELYLQVHLTDRFSVLSKSASSLVLCF